MVTSLGRWNRYLEGNPFMRVVNSLCRTYSMHAEVVILETPVVM